MIETTNLSFEHEFQKNNHIIIIIMCKTINLNCVFFDELDRWCTVCQVFSFFFGTCSNTPAIPTGSTPALPDSLSSFHFKCCKYIIWTGLFTRMMLGQYQTKSIKFGLQVVQNSGNTRSYSFFEIAGVAKISATPAMQSSGSSGSRKVKIGC